MILVQHEPLELSEYQAWLADDTACGAIATFVGLVRNHNEGEPVTALSLEHYPGMTEKALSAIVQEAKARWPLGRVALVHRVGRLAVGDPIVFVGVASAHRQAAFEACAYIMDHLKTQAPFWKKEETPDGAHWVDARISDEAAAERWTS